MVSKGNNASFSEISTQMNILSSLSDEKRPTIELNRVQVSNWFVKHSGKLVSPIEKPLDNNEHRELRKKWVVKYYGLLTNPYTPVCFIDEKWFYRVNRRRAIKVLPHGKGEKGKINKAKKGKMLSQ